MVIQGLRDNSFRARQCKSSVGKKVLPKGVDIRPRDREGAATDKENAPTEDSASEQVQDNFVD